MKQRSGPALAVTVATAAALAWCWAVGLLAGDDPMLLLEVGATALLAAWLLLVSRDLWRARRLADELNSGSVPVVLAGVPCRLLERGPREAFVLGSLGPEIYVGEAFVSVLDDDELRGVLLHEEHHRRTHAPLRTAALEAWLRLTSPLGFLRRVFSARLADLEVSADAFAIARGAEPSALASALLKGDRAPVAGVAFSQAADVRIAALVAAGRGRPHPMRKLPVEWLPLAVVAVAAFGCHVALFFGISMLH